MTALSATTAVISFLFFQGSRGAIGPVGIIGPSGYPVRATKSFYVSLDFTAGDVLCVAHSMK